VRGSRRFLDVTLAALAVGLAIRVLFRRPAPEPAVPEPTRPGEPATRKEWAGSLIRTIRYEIREDESVIISAALAFYALLALVPAAIAAISIYGLVLDPASLSDQIKTVTDALPSSAAQLVTEQIEQLAAAGTTGLTIGLVASVLGVLWVASGGTRALLHGIHLVYNVEERRSWVRQRGLAYLLTLSFIVFGLGTIALVTFLPGWLEELGFGSGGRQAIEIARWPGIFLIVIAGLAFLYRVAPNRPGLKRPLLLPGAVTAAVLWVVATAGFSFYTGSGYSSIDADTYGVLVSVVVLLLWFFVSGFVILLGAEVNATLESHRRR
jgi:membrane protein